MLVACRLAHPKSDLRRLVKKLGASRAAERLRVSEKTLGKALRTGGSEKLRRRAADAWERSQTATRGWETRREREYEEEERAGIAETPMLVPGYGPQKLARVLQDVRNMRGENWVEHQDLKYVIRGLEKRELAVDPKLPAELARLERLQEAMRTLEFHMAPTDTLEERLHKVDNIDKEYAHIARKYNMSARAVYSLYYSPPAGAAV